MIATLDSQYENRRCPAYEPPWKYRGRKFPLCPHANGEICPLSEKFNALCVYRRIAEKQQADDVHRRPGYTRPR